MFIFVIAAIITFMDPIPHTLVFYDDSLLEEYCSLRMSHISFLVLTT